jgi:hypothetical protein
MPIIQRDFSDVYRIDGAGIVYGGIDTEEERRHIDYKPEIHPSKRRAKITDDIVDSLSTELVDEVEESETPFCDSIKDLILTRDRITELIKYAEGKLAPLVVQIDPDEEPQVSQAIIRFCPLNQNDEGVIYNDDKINITLYKKSIEDSSADACIIRDRYQDYVSDINGCVAGEVHSLLWQLRQSFDDTKDFLLSLCETDEGINYPNDDDNRLKSAQEVEANLRQKYNEIYKNIENSKSTKTTDANSMINATTNIGAEIGGTQAVSEVDKPVETLDDFTRWAQMKNETTNDILDKMEMGMKQTVYDNFNKMLCCFIEKIVKVPGLEDAELDLDDKFDKIYDMIDKMKMVLMFKLNYQKKASKFVNDKISSVLSSAMSTVRNIVLKVLQQTMSYVNAPLVNMLDNVVGKNDEYCLPLEQLASTLMDGIEQIEDQYLEHIVDLFRTQKFEVQLFGRQCENLYESQWIRDSYKVLDTVQQSLDAAKAWSVKGQLEDWTYEFMKAHGYDTTYDATEDKVTQITEFTCEGLLGG